jgi:hypothetical protein
VTSRTANSKVAQIWIPDIRPPIETSIDDDELRRQWLAFDRPINNGSAISRDGVR